MTARPGRPSVGAPRAWRPSLGGRGVAQLLLNGLPDGGGRAGLVGLNIAKLLYGATCLEFVRKHLFYGKLYRALFATMRMSKTL
jgi:hypothetical protein